MFLNAESFQHELCGSWVRSQAKQPLMFDGSHGSISRTACTPAPTVFVDTRAAVAFAPTQDTMQNTHGHVSRRPITERELISRTSISTPSTNPTIANTMTCPKCGTFEKSGRVSCCAPGGTWFKKCGGAGNRNVDHRWFEGLETCKRKFKAKRMCAMTRQ